MSENAGDFAVGATVRLRFNTRKADGTPITLAGTPAVSIYKQGSTVESTAGVTLTTDYDSRTGYHSLSVDTSADGSFYAAGNDFFAAITAGTVDGVSVIGANVGRFSIRNRTALAYDAYGNPLAPASATTSIAATLAAGVPLAANQDVRHVTGDVQGKTLGGGSSTITGTGVRAVDSGGNAIPTAAQNAAATRDVSNASPAAGSLGAYVNEAASSATSSASYAASAVSSLTTVLARIGAFTGSGANTILGLLKAVASKSAPLPSDVGGTFDPATDSVEALRDRGDAGSWAGNTSSLAAEIVAAINTDGVTIKEFSATALAQISARGIVVTSPSVSSKRLKVYVGTTHSIAGGTAWTWSDPAGQFPAGGTWRVELFQNDVLAATGDVALISGDPGETQVYAGEMAAAETANMTTQTGSFFVIQQIDGEDVLRWYGVAEMVRGKKAA